MPYYRITNRLTNSDLGCYEAETRAHALACMWTDAGLEAWVEDGEARTYGEAHLDWDEVSISIITDEEMLDSLPLPACHVCAGVLEELPDLCEMHIKELAYR